MLTRKLLRPLAGQAPRYAAARALTTTPAGLQAQRTPSLGDIEPDKQEAFKARQKEFRAQVAEAQKQREASGYSSSSVSSPSSSSSSSSPASSSSSSSSSPVAAPPSRDPKHEDGEASLLKGFVKELGLGSLSTASSAEHKAEAEGKQGGRRGGPLANLIYGTKEGREMDAQIEASFSQVLARGKYVHSIVFHQVKPDRVDEYVKLVGAWYPKMASMPENKVHLVGSWRTEVGDCDTFVHIWEYQRYQGYHASLHSISQHPDFPDFDHKLKQLITSKTTSLMQEFSFWPTTPPRQLGGLFELRSYTLHPGNLLEWETHWRRGLKARREVMEGVGAWFVQIGDLNTVHHLWQFANLEERKLRRERSWSVEGWSDTVHKTVPLIQAMKSRILIPMPWSPVA